eukprot:403354542
MMQHIQKRMYGVVANQNMKPAAKKWMERHLNDPFVKQAKLQAYRSRAAYKLMEIDNKFSIFKKGMKVIDVGCAPGGWSQIIAEKVDSQPGSETAVGVDLIEIIPVKGVKFIQGDIQKQDIQDKISEALDFQKADLILSDAVPDFVGERYIDHMKSVNLNHLILKFCEKNLRPGGLLLMKIMQGPAEQDLFDYTKLLFDNLQRVKPSASRQESKEIYLLGKGWEESQNENMIKIRKELARFNNAKSEQEQSMLMEELMKEAKVEMKKGIEEILKTGQEIPDEFKSELKSVPEAADINLEQKMSLREKQKALKKFKQDQDREFEEKTGIVNKSENWTMDNLIKKYQYDMAQYDKKLEKMKKLDEQGVQYNPDEVVVSDEENSAVQDPFKLSNKKVEYDDTPYQQDDPLQHINDEYEKLKINLDKLQNLGDKFDDIDPNHPNFEKYQEFFKDMDKVHSMAADYEDQTFEDSMDKDEQRTYADTQKTQRKSKDAYFDKQQKRQHLKKTGGVKKDSPVWNDSDEED